VYTCNLPGRQDFRRLRVAGAFFFGGCESAARLCRRFSVEQLNGRWSGKTDIIQSQSVFLFVMLSRLWFLIVTDIAHTQPHRNHSSVWPQTDFTSHIKYKNLSVYKTVQERLNHISKTAEIFFSKKLTERTDGSYKAHVTCSHINVFILGYTFNFWIIADR